MPARRVWTPGEAPASRPWGQDEEAPGTSLQQKKSCSKNLRLVRTCPAPPDRAGDSGGHRTGHLRPKSELRAAGEAQERLSIPASAAAASSRGGRGAPERSAQGRGQAVAEGGDTLGLVQREAERWHRPRAAPRRHPLPSAPATMSLTNGQGHLKTWPLQHRGCKGNRRQVGGRRDA